MKNHSQISVVDDDESVRESFEGLLKSMGHAVEVFSSAESFLNSEAHKATKCLILDVRMPGMSGPGLRRELMRRQMETPIIFITSHDEKDVISEITVGGSVNCLKKPFSEDSLLNAISRALSCSTERQSFTQPQNAL